MVLRPPLSKRRSLSIRKSVKVAYYKNATSAYWNICPRCTDGRRVLRD